MIRASHSECPDLASSCTVPTVLVQDSSRENCWLRFEGLQEVLVARETSDVVPTLESAQRASDAGFCVAGFITYEAAPGVDQSLHVHPPDSVLPLVWFGVFASHSEETLALSVSDGKPFSADWLPSMDRDVYSAAIERIREYLHAGDTYQVNYTLRLAGHMDASPWQVFLQMCAAQQARCCAYVETESFAICSASPELFLLRRGRSLKSMPMKGTCARGLTLAQDEAMAEELQRSHKTQAENVMITDMIRNDMGKIAEAGSVKVPSLYDVKRYPTLWQMTSTVECTTEAEFPEIMTALFPCSSITGAPKVRTMDIIRKLEITPRGLYTGSIGYLLPEGEMHWNVAIRTLVLDKETGEGQYGIGSGIVWDSENDAEYEECLLKAEILASRWPEFDLLETLRWTPEEGYGLLQRHMDRLCASAAYFQYLFEADAITAALEAVTSEWGGEEARRVRLLLSQDGGVRIESFSLPGGVAGEPWRVCLACGPVECSDPFLYHKTTHRKVYEAARQGCGDVDDVMLWNAAGEVTETTIANVVVEQDGHYLTPPVSAGLLNGTMRQELLAQGRIEEARVTCDMLKHCDGLFLVNSVRGWIPAVLV
jgi:para-aminobenzoate synthetase/4-amino-4-deoxychorismate lyase